MVKHDLGVPRPPANIDHLVIAPTAVYASDSKHDRGVTLGRGTLWDGDGRSPGPSTPCAGRRNA